MAAKAWTTNDPGRGVAVRVNSRPRAATGAEGAAPSPALMLQQALDAEMAGVADIEPRKWPPAATAAFILLTCGAFWAAVAMGVARAFG
jgi:hypothetical protein